MNDLNSDSMFGGNEVVSLADGWPSVQLANGPYNYRVLSLVAGQSHTVDGLRSYAVYCLKGEPGDAVASVGGALRQGDVLKSEGMPITLTGVQASVLLVAGIVGDVRPDQGVKIVRSADHYRVSKPWGHELWLNGEHPGFVLKEVFIRAGNRTSLQYHHFKEETNLLVSGTARLVYKASRDVSNDRVREPHLGEAPFRAPAYVHIVPEVLHRLIADTDVLLYEASTPHLDDVVRVQDDSGRQHGRIEQEHRR
jgi:mannose-6-phosphate isomerase